jgi:DNA-directed RNA polymerase specialized sigma24 family protein
VDKRIKDLKDFVRRRQKPIGEILYDKRELRRYLVSSWNYNATVASKLAKHLFTNDINFRATVDRVIKHRREAQSRHCKRLLITHNFKRITPLMREAMKLQDEGFKLKEIMEKLGRSKMAVKLLLLRGRKKLNDGIKFEDDTQRRVDKDGANPMRPSSYLT